jgi:phenylalanyl-tRNA synthetase beta subunit
VFRSASRTLTDDEVNGALQSVHDEISKTAGYQIRK